MSDFVFTDWYNISVCVYWLVQCQCLCSLTGWLVCWCLCSLTVTMPVFVFTDCYNECLCSLTGTMSVFVFIDWYNASVCVRWLVQCQCLCSLTGWLVQCWCLSSLTGTMTVFVFTDWLTGTMAVFVFTDWYNVSVCIHWLVQCQGLCSLTGTMSVFVSADWYNICICVHCLVQCQCLCLLTGTMSVFVFTDWYNISICVHWLVQCQYLWSLTGWQLPYNWGIRVLDVCAVIQSYAKPSYLWHPAWNLMVIMGTNYYNLTVNVPTNTEHSLILWSYRKLVSVSDSQPACKLWASW